MPTDTLGIITTAGVTAHLSWPLVWIALAAFVPGSLVAGRWLRGVAIALWTWVREYDEAREVRLAEEEPAT